MPQYFRSFLTGPQVDLPLPTLEEELDGEPYGFFPLSYRSYKLRRRSQTVLGRLPVSQEPVEDNTPFLASRVHLRPPPTCHEVPPANPGGLNRQCQLKLILFFPPNGPVSLGCYLCWSPLSIENEDVDPPRISLIQLHK